VTSASFLRVLFVDDAGSDVEGLRRVVRARGDELLPGVARGEAELEAALAQTWSAVLCPARVELVAFLRQRSDAPLLALTARGDDGAAGACLAAGADDVVERARPTRLLRALLRAIELEGLRARLASEAAFAVVGRVAEGLAHDLNNLLTVITCSAEVMLDEIEPAHEDVAAILSAAAAAGRLTSLLGRLNRAEGPEVVELGWLVSGLMPLLGAVARGKNVTYCVEVAAAAGVTVQLSAAHVQQVILNLAINACEAMPEGGRITLGARRTHLDEAGAAAWPGTRPGDYVAVTVVDEGEGMDAVTRAQAFDPYFTTKAAPEGRGVGLALVHELVQRSGGAVRLSSSPGQGTRVELLLPCALAAGTLRRAGEGPPSRGGSSSPAREATCA
jgi:signal transduction histidine kinase